MIDEKGDHFVNLGGGNHMIVFQKKHPSAVQLGDIIEEGRQDGFQIGWSKG